MNNKTTNLLLVAITLLLAVIAANTLRAPSAVMAQTPDVDYFIEPGTFLVRTPEDGQQAYAKVVVDLRNGRIWGFPTLAPLPYPSNPLSSKAETSHPFLLGRFALEDTKKYIPDQNK